MKLMYTRPEDNGVSIVVAAPKEVIERVLGPLTQKQYETHVMERSIPEGALNVKIIKDEDIPNTREFRNAWVDVTEDSKINIDLVKAKDIALAELRKTRNEELDKLDKKLLIERELGNDVSSILEEKKALREITDPLKNLEVSGVDNEEILETLRKLKQL